MSAEKKFPEIPRRRRPKPVAAGPPVLPATGLLRLPQVLQFIPVSASQFWAGTKDGRFPAGKKLSPRVTVWTAESIREFLDQFKAQN